MSEKYILPKADSPRMFDAIAKRYDFLNHVLSLGQDRRWRARLKDCLPLHRDLHVLDLATGTADVLITLATGTSRLKRGIGVDLSLKMLEIGRGKIAAASLSDRLCLEQGDAQALPFLDASFDCVCIAFGLRNIPDLRLALLEMYRVTKPGGRVLILEFSKPKNFLLQAGHWLYLNGIVPFVGGIFSGHFHAYRYLNATIQSFPYGEQLSRILKQFGFVHIQRHLLMGGVATIYAADK